MKRFNQGFATLIGLLLTMAIICLLGYIAYKVYFKPPAQQKGIPEALSGQGIDSSTYRSVLESSRKQIEETNREILERARQLEEME